jgi:hypothetical protein
MHLALRFGLLAILPSGIAVGAPAPTITKSEVRSDRPNVTDRRLKDVVWSLFEKQDHRRGKEPTRPLSSLFLRTRTQATRVPGLCRYDSVRVEFEQVNPKDEGADAPVRPVGLTSTSNFAFLSAPSADDEDSPQDRLVSVSQCSKLPVDERFFTAEDENEADQGYRAWLALLETVRAGRKVPLECDLAPSDKGPCEAVIAAIKPEHLSEVRTCAAGSDSVCHQLFAEDRLITVMTAAYARPGLSAGQVVSAKLDSLIVMAHAIID